MSYQGQFDPYSYNADGERQPILARRQDQGFVVHRSSQFSASTSLKSNRQKSREAITLEQGAGSSTKGDIDFYQYDGLVLSPGPGLPKESGQLMPILKQAFGNIPILGICLGMQALAEHCGASLYNRRGVMHGRTVQLENIKPSILLNGLEAKIVGLYHSWAVNAESLGEDWCICATAMDDFAPMVMENSQKSFCRPVPS